MPDPKNNALYPARCASCSVELKSPDRSEHRSNCPWYEAPSLADVIRRVPCPEGVSPEVHAIKVMTEHFLALGDEPCSECGYSLNEISAYVQIVVAAKELCRSGYDGPFMGDEVAPLFRAVAAYEAAQTGNKRHHGA